MSKGNSILLSIKEYSDTELVKHLGFPSVESFIRTHGGPFSRAKVAELYATELFLLVPTVAGKEHPKEKQSLKVPKNRAVLPILLEIEGDTDEDKWEFINRAGKLGVSRDSATAIYSAYWNQLDCSDRESPFFDWEEWIDTIFH